MSQDAISKEHSVTAPDQMTLTLERTYLANERTLLAWTRATTSLITFGFTLDQFFEYLHERGKAARSPRLFQAEHHELRFATLAGY